MDYIIKKPDKLSEEEFKQIQQHVNVEHFLKNQFVDFSKRYQEHIIFGAIEHHERYSGGGYLKNKKGMEISFAGRLIAICDVFDALLRERPYKTAFKPDEAMRHVEKFTNEGYFDPLIFKKFYKTLGKYPIGSALKTNRDLGIVVQQSGKFDRPIIFFKDIGEIDTSKDNSIKILN